MEEWGPLARTVTVPSAVTLVPAVIVICVWVDNGLVVALPPIWSTKLTRLEAVLAVPLKATPVWVVIVTSKYALACWCWVPLIAGRLQFVTQRMVTVA